MVSLLTSHIGWAIKDFLEEREIQGSPVTRADPFADEQYRINIVDVTDPHNPVLFTTGGVFRISIIRVDAPEEPQPRPMKDITPPDKGLPFHPGSREYD